MGNAADDLAQSGFVVFDHDPRVALWATRTHQIATGVVSDPQMKAMWLRHGKTWFVGVDALPNGADGSIDGTALTGPWEQHIAPPENWHSAQISVVYRGYPQQDSGETDAAHRYRVMRSAAHVDGLHLEDGRRIVRECHGFILGLPLNHAQACPLVAWRGSHHVMQRALHGFVRGRDPYGQDVTEVYKAARQEVFDTCERVEVTADVGQSMVLHRLVVHGVAPDDPDRHMPEEGRMVAYFRPELSARTTWLDAG